VKRTSVFTAKWSYLIPVVIWIVGLVSCLAILISQLDDFGRSLVRFVAPGEMVIQCVEGTYTVFYEYRSVVGNELYETTEPVTGLTVEVYQKGTGQSIPVHSSRSSTIYQFGSYEGRSVFTFSIAQPGSYVVRAQYHSGSGPQIVLSIGKDDSFTWAVIGGLLVALTSVLLGFSLLRKIRIKRGKPPIRWKYTIGLVQMWLLYIFCILTVLSSLIAAVSSHEWQDLVGVVAAPFIFLFFQILFIVGFGIKDTRALHAHVLGTARRLFRQ
jgi:uncharacterized membrane protein